MQCPKTRSLPSGKSIGDIVTGGVTEIAKNATSIGTGLLAGVITNAIDPNQKLGHQGDLLATAGINVALDAGVATLGTGIVSGSLGAGVIAGASTIAEGALPVIAGYEVGDTVYTVMQWIKQHKIGKIARLWRLYQDP